ncbi:hypothetical protein ACOI1H_15060 [Loktanella sp. DJP18]|uniref:hypothetical protein n=1 Tax=Loktanella sp. DJP18 TaxID=3409788 RepID=UPI003BB7E0E0
MKPDKPVPPVTPPPLRRSLPRLILRLTIIGLLVWAGLALFDWLQGHIADLEDAARARAMTTLVVVSILAYAAIIAIPFVPAIEIAIALMVMEGPIIAPFVWLATVLGLLAAYVVGRRVSLDWLHGLFRDLHMIRACAMIYRIKTEPPENRLASLSDRLPRWLAPLATRYRYGLLAVVLNVPGNMALGGGGGILMAAGISRLFTPGWTLLTVMLATAPVPLAVWFMGADILK